jgi:hypothetical protein
LFGFAHGNLQKLYAATTEDSTNEAVQPQAMARISKYTLTATTTALSKAQTDAMTSTETHMLSC